MPATPSTSLPDAERILRLERELEWAHLKIRFLEERLRLERIKKYGPASEKPSDAQLELLDLEPGVSNVEVQAESGREPLPASQPKTERRPHPGRQELPADLPRVERVCKKCEAGGVVAAPAPARIVEKSLVSDREILDAVVAKYGDRVPLYRQSAILERETGLEIHRATLDGWVMRVGELAVPIAAAMRCELLSGTYIQADETPVDVQMHDGGGRNHQAYLWQYGRPGAGVVFDFRMGRGRDGPRQFLGKFEGLLQTDGYIAYEGVGGPQLVHAGCWSHARRHFFDAVKLNPGDAAATRVVVAIDELFAIGAEARARNLDVAARQALRWEQAPAVLEIVRGRVEAARTGALPASALARAANYTLTLWPKLTRFLEHPELELSNNLAENSMRPVALGRNYVQPQVMYGACESAHRFAA